MPPLSDLPGSYSVSKKKLSIIVLLLIILFVFLTVFGYLLGSGMFTSQKFRMLKSDIVKKIGINNGKKYLKTKKAQVDTSISKSKIIGPKGGKITVVDRKGTKIILDIPAGALPAEREITLTPLVEPPVEDFDQAWDIPGVLVDPLDIRFETPAVLVFDLDPGNDVMETGGNPSLSGPSSGGEIEEASSGDDDMTPPERERRNTARIVHIGSNPGVLYANPPVMTGGGNARFIPAESEPEASEITTRAGGGGTYSYDGEVDRKAAIDNINDVLNGPNSTFEEVLEAGSLAQQWGLEELDSKAQEKLKGKMDQAAAGMGGDCEKGLAGISQSDVLKWQGLAQTLGYEEQEEKFRNLLEKCRGNYFFEISCSPPSAPWITYTFKANILCGHLDGSWEGMLTGKNLGTTPSGNAVGRWDRKQTFKFPPPGRSVRVNGSYTVSLVYYQGSQTYENNPVDITYFGDNIVQVGIGWYDCSAQTAMLYKQDCGSNSNP